MRTISQSPQMSDAILIFPSDLGWMAVAVAGDAIQRLTFGHRSAAAARKAMAACAGDVVIHISDISLSRKITCSQATILRRLQAFAAGKADTLCDIPIDPGRLSEFQRRVIRCCRRIPYGQTLSYAELAAEAGFPGAARAVGNCMAANRIPLVIPCHRVVRADGKLGRYSAPGGILMKRRLLTLESSNWPRID